MRRRRRLRRLSVGLGIFLGLALGLALSWGLFPRMPRYARWPELREAYKDDYVLLLSLAYAQEGDLAQVQRELALLEEPDVARRVARLADKAIAEGWPAAERRSLARLAHALGESTTAIMAYVATPRAADSPTPTPVPPTPTGTASPTPTVAPPTYTPWARLVASPTPEPTRPRAAFVLIEKERLQGDANARPGHLIVLVTGPRSEGLPGVKVRVTWEGERDALVTGLHPGRDAGYADFRMEPGVSYTVYIAEEASERAEGLVIEPTQPEAEGPYRPDSWRLVFRRQQ